MEAALSKAAPDCCFKHVSVLYNLYCDILPVLDELLGSLNCLSFRLSYTLPLLLTAV